MDSNIEKFIFRIEDLSKQRLDSNDELLLRLINFFNEYGFLLIQESIGTDHIKSFNELKYIFGDPIYHNMSDRNGIHPITYIPGRLEYGNATRGCLSFHTDGTFEKIQPKLMMVRCLRKAAYGGMTRILDGKVLYNFLYQKLKESIEDLFIEDCITVQRDNRINSTPVFRKVSNGRIQIAFREGSDVTIKINKKSSIAYNMMREFLCTTDQSIDFYLEPDQTLIMDNTRILHARTGFNDNQRKLMGLWLDGNSKFSNSKLLKFGIPVETGGDCNH